MVARDRNHRRAGVGRGRPRGGRADVEEVAAHGAREVHAFAMLRVHLARDGDADAAELIARRVEHLAAPVEQAAERSAGHDARQIHGARARAHGQHGSLRVERVNGRGELRGLEAEHQRLTIADEYTSVVCLGDYGHADFARQLVDERIALEQIVGRLAA